YERIEDSEAEVILMKESMAGTLESNLLLNRFAPFLSLKSGDRIAFPLDTGVLSSN
ncbi:hypothetical protein V1524DRAFT_422989, partial [Lipomyces starkeyi]